MFKRVLSSLALAVVAMTTAHAGAQISKCPGDHCSKVRAEINAACVANAQAGRDMYLQLADQSMCSCHCSCVAEGTSTYAYLDMPTDVQGLDRSLPVLALVQNLKEQQPLYTPIASYVGIHKILRTGDSAGSELLVVEFRDGRKLTVSKNHTFIDNLDRVIAAEELEPGVKIKSGKEGKIARVKSVTVTTDSLPLYNVMLNPKSVHAEDHVWFTGGIWSGDFMLQSANDLMNSEIRLRATKLRPEIMKLGE